MKLLDRIGLAFFSVCMLLISIFTCSVLFGWLQLDFIYDIANRAIQNQTAYNIILTANIAVILLAIKCIFFESKDQTKVDYKNGILLENSDGKLLITKETLESLVNGVVSGFESAQNVSTRVELDKENNVRVFVNMSVKENAIIKELSSNLQTKIKTTIKTTSDLEVKEVNIRVKGVEKQMNENQG